MTQFGIKELLLTIFGVAFLVFVGFALFKYMNESIAIGLIGTFTTLVSGSLGFWLGGRGKTDV